MPDLMNKEAIPLDLWTRMIHGEQIAEAYCEKHNCYLVVIREEEDSFSLIQFDNRNGDVQGSVMKDTNRVSELLQEVFNYI